MRSETQKPKIGLHTAVGLTLVLLLKTAVLLSNCYVYGRLAMPPAYNDVSYFVDALERVNVFRAEGLRGVISGIISSPPHAPYSTLAAFAGFLVSGGSRAAPYVMNALAVAGLTLFWLVMFRVGQLSAWLIAVMITATGWFDITVTVYDPDLIAGYGAAVVASLAIYQHEVLTTSRRMSVAGAVAGLVLLVKPTALPMVLTLWGIAFVAGMLASRAENITLLASLRRSWIFFLPLILIAGPYFALELPTILRYNYTVFVTEYSTWVRMSQAGNPWTFFILSTGELFRIWLYLGAAAFAIVAIAAVRDHRAPLICLGGLVACLFIAYIPPTVVAIKVIRLGGVLYGMVLVTGLVAVTRLTTFLPPSERIAAQFRKSQGFSVALLLIVFGIITAFETKDRQDRFPLEYTTKMSAEFERVYSVLREMTVRSNGQFGLSLRILAYFPTVWVAPHAYRFQALEDGLDININQEPLQTDLDHVLSSARKADIIFIPDGRLLATYFPYPVNALLGDLVQELRKDPTMVESTPIELHDGAMFIFRRRRPA